MCTLYDAGTFSKKSNVGAAIVNSIAEGMAYIMLAANEIMDSGLLDASAAGQNGQSAYTPVSYTHLDVYKRQILFNASSGAKDNNKATINENPTTIPPSKPSTAFSRIIICIPADNCEAIR